MIAVWLLAVTTPRAAYAPPDLASHGVPADRPSARVEFSKFILWLETRTAVTLVPKIKQKRRWDEQRGHGVVQHFVRRPPVATWAL